jgi:hypothetical protein
MWKGQLVIAAQVYVVCDVPPERHILSVRLERRVGGGPWVVMASDVFKNPPTKRGEFYNVAFVGCEPGQWHTRAKATGSLQGSPFSFEDTSRVRSITAQDCEQARKRLSG